MPTDPRSLRADAPLLDAWLRFQESAPTPFTIPGHKQRHDLVGDVVAGDVPLYGGLDTMKPRRGPHDCGLPTSAASPPVVPPTPIRPSRWPSGAMVAR